MIISTGYPWLKGSQEPSKRSELAEGKACLTHVIPPLSLCPLTVMTIIDACMRISLVAAQKPPKRNAWSFLVALSFVRRHVYSLRRLYPPVLQPTPTRQDNNQDNVFVFRSNFSLLARHV